MPSSFKFCRRLVPFQICRLSFFAFLVAFIFLCISPLELALGQPYAQGNLFIVFNPKSGRTSDQNPQMANLTSLWCQATPNSFDKLQIKEARFVRTLPKPEQVIPASKYNKKKERAFLEFGQVTTSAIGKYRCEITTQDDELVTGNLFVYMRPILVHNATTRLDPVEEGNLFAWMGPAIKSHEGDETTLDCQVIGYPLPQIRWFKDGTPINTSALLASPNGEYLDGRKYSLVGQSLLIRQVDENDEGNYKCVATNEFAPHIDEQPHEFQLIFEQQIRITTTLSWLIPLLIIIAGLVLLALIIWGCSQWKRYKYEQYNVAQKERELGKKGVADGQKLPLDHDDVED